MSWRSLSAVACLGRLATRAAHQFGHLFHDQFLNCRAERTEEPRIGGFIAALSQDPRRRRVAEHVIRVARDPRVVPSILAFQPERIIHHDLSRERDELQGTPELPHLYSVDRKSTRLNSSHLGISYA